MTDTLDFINDEITDVNDPTAEWAEILQAYNTRIRQIEDLDALTEPEAGGRKKLNDLIADEANAEIVRQAREVIASVNEADEHERLILAAVLLSEGSQVFRPIRDKFVKDNSKEVEQLPQDQLDAIAARRDKLVGAVTGLRVTLKAMIDNETMFESVRKPPRKKSNNPATGKRIKGEFFFTVGGEKFNVKDGVHQSSKASELAKSLEVKTGTISSLLEQKGLNPGELPDAWELDINGKHVLAERNQDAIDTPDDDDDENGNVEENED